MTGKYKTRMRMLCAAACAALALPAAAFQPVGPKADAKREEAGAAGPAGDMMPAGRQGSNFEATGKGDHRKGYQGLDSMPVTGDDTDRLLLRAVERGDYKEVRNLLEQGVKITPEASKRVRTGWKGQTALDPVDPKSLQNQWMLVPVQGGDPKRLEFANGDEFRKAILAHWNKKDVMVGSVFFESGFLETFKYPRQKAFLHDALVTALRTMREFRNDEDQYISVYLLRAINPETWDRIVRPVGDSDKETAIRNRAEFMRLRDRDIERRKIVALLSEKTPLADRDSFAFFAVKASASGDFDLASYFLDEYEKAWPKLKEAGIDVKTGSLLHESMTGGTSLGVLKVKTFCGDLQDDVIARSGQRTTYEASLDGKMLHGALYNAMLEFDSEKSRGFSRNGFLPAPDDVARIVLEDVISSMANLRMDETRLMSEGDRLRLSGVDRMIPWRWEDFKDGVPEAVSGVVMERDTLAGDWPETQKRFAGNKDGLDRTKFAQKGQFRDPHYKYGALATKQALLHHYKRLLARKGVEDNLNSQNYCGRTIVHRLTLASMDAIDAYGGIVSQVTRPNACLMGSVIRDLLERGVNPNALDILGSSAFGHLTKLPGKWASLPSNKPIVDTVESAFRLKDFSDHKECGRDEDLKRILDKK